MRKDSRLSRVLHVLIHLDSYNHPVTSETLANMLMTNPVVVRRTMALLRQAGYVSAIKGHNGGWLLATPLTDITLFDIHQALGEKNLFVIGLTDEHSNCPIEHAVNSALQNAMDDAEALLLKRFAEVSLAELASQFKK
ncbi:Rrf2 family transcriptional regulator [Pseudoalteromonas sp. BZK2]|uniref:Rrf2 family transcriptional regulator n=1 Tax=Pseudoalteromonas TaxID=53246 RepID=UPI0007C5C13B|nr:MULTISPECIES: Rrf2 family transcriptional regulator [Pseudoalteromonas]MBC7007075.1 Rrf2 family transcriptional regulator [Pseudoalteromonas sp. BZK2]TMO28633.1 Rrf2 family transcriptional regulator [Pseudoalteromonas sp. S4492]